MVKYTVPGAPIPTKIRELWKEYQGQGYGVCIDFPPPRPSSAGVLSAKPRLAGERW